MKKMTIVALILVALGGCDEDEDPSCVAGSLVACPCAGGAIGWQRCEGGYFGRCDCPPAATDHANDGDDGDDAVPGPVALEPDDDGACGAVVCPEVAAPCPSVSECDGALASGARVSVRTASSEYQTQALYLASWLCDEASSTYLYEWARQRAFGGGGNIGFAGFTFGMNANSSRSEQQREFRSWQRQRCESDVSDFSEEAVASMLSSIEDSTAPLRAWASCVHDVVGAYASCRRSAGGFARAGYPTVQGLILESSDLEVPRGSAFELRVRWCGVPGSVESQVAEVRDFEVSGATCAGPAAVAPGALLCPGDVTVRCTRTSSDAVRASLNVLVSSPGGSQTAMTASAYMPATCGDTNGPCCNDRCAFPEDECIEGWCAPRCHPGERRCTNGDCETASATSCGAACQICEAPPGARATCTAGQCAFECMGSTTRCGRGCVELSTDEENCGACGHVCRDDQMCRSGACGCPAGEVECRGVCQASCTEVCDGVDNDRDGEIDEGCPVLTARFYGDDCNQGCNCAVGSGSALRESVALRPGQCYDLQVPNRAAQIDFLRQEACRRGRSIRISLYKQAGCRGSVPQTRWDMIYACDWASHAYNLNCFDSNNDRIGDYDNHVVSIRVSWE
ncbi:MAG: hypothetical protein H6706_19745 [Myxococcales bacterium]|nr:hypothetical protein [Myxococcales bacterium]